MFATGFKLISTDGFKKRVYEAVLSEGALAKQRDLPTSSVQDLLNTRCKITANTSVRLSRTFGVSDRYFLNLQNDIDSRKAENI